VRLLLELGADPNRYDDRRGPLAFMAAQVSDQVILQDLWQHGANLDAKYSVNGMTALQQALVSGNDSMVKFLIKQGADPDVQNDAGWTALMVATCRDRPEFGWVGLLLEHGANRSLKDKAGHIALDYAVQCNSTNSVQLLR
jgi:ankyrin repeat protein